MSKRTDLLSALHKLGAKIDNKASNEELEKQLLALQSTPNAPTDPQGESGEGDKTPKLPPDSLLNNPAENETDVDEDETDQDEDDDVEDIDDTVEDEDDTDQKEPTPRLSSEQSDEELPEVKETDYLRKFQYRKQTVFGSVESDPVKGSKAETMKKHLLSQPRVRIYIPRQGKEDPRIKLTVNLNGYRLDFPKGQYIEVPRQIAEVVMDSQQQIDEALERNQITGNKEKEKALS